MKIYQFVFHEQKIDYMLHKKFNQDLATYNFWSKKLIHVK